MRLRYTPEALAELDALVADIAAHSPQGAKRVLARIDAMTTLMLHHPRSGQPTSLGGMRRMVVTPYPYLIFYEPGDGEIIVVGIRHGARDPSSMPNRT